MRTYKSLAVSDGFTERAQLPDLVRLHLRNPNGEISMLEFWLSDDDLYIADDMSELLVSYKNVAIYQTTEE